MRGRQSPVAWRGPFRCWRLVVNWTLLRAAGVFGEPFAILRDVAGAEAGGGGAPSSTADPAIVAGSGDASDGGAAASADADGAHEAELSDEDLLFGDEQAGQAQETDAQRVESLRKANNRFKRKYLKAKETLDRVKGLGDLDQLVQRARQYDELESAIQRNPKLRALLSDHSDSDDPTAPPARETRPAASSKLPALPSAFDARSLGFDPADPDNPASGVLAATIQHVVDLRNKVDELMRLAPSVRSLEQSSAHRQATEERGQWTSALSSLKTKLQEAAPGNELLVEFATDALVGAFQTRRQHGRTPDQVVKHYLDRMQKAGQISKKVAAQVSAGVQARAAEHNRTLPKSPAGGGAPASPQGNQRKTLKDVHKQLRSGALGPR